MIPAQYAKFLTAAAAAIGAILANGLAHGDVQHYLTVAVVVLGALGVYAVPNAPDPSAPPSPAVRSQIGDLHQQLSSAQRQVGQQAPPVDPAPILAEPVNIEARFTVQELLSLQPLFSRDAPFPPGAAQ